MPPTIEVDDILFLLKTFMLSYSLGLPYALSNHVEQNVADNRVTEPKGQLRKRSAPFK